MSAPKMQAKDAVPAKVEDPKGHPQQPKGAAPAKTQDPKEQHKDQAHHCKDAAAGKADPNKQAGQVKPEELARSH